MSTYRYPSGEGQNGRKVEDRLQSDLRNVESGIRGYYRNRRDNPALLRSLESRKRELEAAIRRLPKS